MVFVMVLLAALISTGAIVQSLAYYLEWSFENSDCRGEVLLERSRDSVAASLAKQRARELQTELDKTKGAWIVSVRAEGRALIYTYRYKEPVQIGFLQRNQTQARGHEEYLHRAAYLSFGD